MTISFCFTIKLKNSIHLIDRYKHVIEKAVECALLHHKVNFYTDIETLPYLNISNTNVKLIDTTDFYFVDDFKVHLLTIIDDDEVIVDTDLFLFKPLYLEPGCDAHFDFMDNSNKIWYTENLDFFMDNGIRELIPNFNINQINVPNIGILKIPNRNLKEKYIELYYKIRKWSITRDLFPSIGISVILGQYLLALLINEYNINYCSNYRNHYAHLSGPNKFKTSGVINFHPSKSSKLL